MSIYLFTGSFVISFLRCSVTFHSIRRGEDISRRYTVTGKTSYGWGLQKRNKQQLLRPRHPFPSFLFTCVGEDGPDGKKQMPSKKKVF